MLKPSVFISGVVGDWRDKFSPKLEVKVGKWIKKNLSDLGIVQI